VDVLGINCSVGPVAMLDAIERVRAVTSLPWPRNRMPACRARSKDETSISVRRNIWRATRENSWPPGATHRRLLWHHARHIRAMKSALRVREARGKTAISEAIHTGVAPSAPASIPIAERSRLAQELRLGNL